MSKLKKSRLKLINYTNIGVNQWKSKKTLKSDLDGVVFNLSNICFLKEVFIDDQNLLVKKLNLSSVGISSSRFDSGCFFFLLIEKKEDYCLIYCILYFICPKLNSSKIISDLKKQSWLRSDDKSIKKKVVHIFNYLHFW